MIFHILIYYDIIKEDYIYAAKLRNKCRQKGITTGSFDFHIASVAIRNTLTLITYDKDFLNWVASHSAWWLNIA